MASNQQHGQLFIQADIEELDLVEAAALPKRSVGTKLGRFSSPRAGWITGLAASSTEFFVAIRRPCATASTSVVSASKTL